MYKDENNWQKLINRRHVLEDGYRRETEHSTSAMSTVQTYGCQVKNISVLVFIFGVEVSIPKNQNIRI